MKNSPNLVNLMLNAFLLLIFIIFPRCAPDTEIAENYPTFPPSVTTNNISNVSNISAVGGGNVTSEGSADVIACGVCWHHTPEPTINQSVTVDGSGEGPFTSDISVLTPNTTYYVRAYATNENETSYGGELSFTTTVTGFAPSVITNPVTAITGSTASCGGEVIDPGSSAVIIFGVCWSVSPNPYITDEYTNDGTGVGSFSSLLTGLNSNTTYFVRAYATNNEGTGYGNEVSFNSSGTGTSGNPCPGLPFVTDSRDGQLYPTVQVGNQCWLHKNMNYTMDSSWCWDNEGSNCNTYGRLYNWQSALGACPEGWHLPDYDEWATLLNFVGSDAGGKLKEEGLEHWLSPNAGATNEFYFTALPGGFWMTGSGFYSINGRAAFWTSTEKSPSSPLAWYTYLVHYNSTAYTMDNSKTYGFSVRCLKN